MKKALLLLSLVIGLSVTCKAQSVAYYPFSSILSVSTNPDLRVWGDLRFQTNSFFSSLSTEIAPAININQNQKGRFYLGGGIRLNYLASFQDGDVFEGYFFNVGVRSAPFDKYPQVQIAFELSPYVASDFESGLLRTRLGVAYNFSRKNK